MAETPFFIASEQTAQSMRFDRFVGKTLDTIHEIQKKRRITLGANAFRLAFSDNDPDMDIPELPHYPFSNTALAHFEQQVAHDLLMPNKNSNDTLSVPRTASGRIPLFVVGKNDHSPYRIDETFMRVLPEQELDLAALYDDPETYRDDLDGYALFGDESKDDTPLHPRYRALPPLDTESAATISHSIGFWGKKPNHLLVKRYWQMRPMIMMRDVLDTPFSTPAIPAGMLHQLTHAEYIIDNTYGRTQFRDQNDMGEKTATEQVRGFANAMQEVDTRQYSHVHALVTGLYRCLAPENPAAARWSNHPDDTTEHSYLDDVISAHIA